MDEPLFFIKTQYKKPRGYRPEFADINNWLFPFEDENSPEAVTAATEAHLADAVARVGTSNGMEKGEIQSAFTAILRILKSKSEWAK